MDLNLHQNMAVHHLKPMVRHLVLIDIDISFIINQNHHSVIRLIDCIMETGTLVSDMTVQSIGR